MTAYIHGTAAAEQQRLIAQARRWRSLILEGLDPQPGQRLLEIGCGVGAVLDVIGEAHPGLRLLGIDREPAQIARARALLAPRQAELVVGDAVALPWPDAHVDEVRLMWVVEHLRDPEAALAEAHRVLRPGGRLVVIETDYTSFRTNPPDAAIAHLLERFVALFRRHGDPEAGPRLGALLERAGFQAVEVSMRGLHHWLPGQAGSQRELVDYIRAFIEPEAAAMATAPESDPALLQLGLERFAGLAELPGGAFSGDYYRAVGRA